MFDKMKEAAASAVAKRQPSQGQTANQQQTRPRASQPANPKSAAEQPRAAQRVASKPVAQGQKAPVNDAAKKPQPSQAPTKNPAQKARPATGEVPRTSQPSQAPVKKPVQKPRSATNEVPGASPPKTAQDTPKEVAVRPAPPAELNEKFGILSKVRESAGKHIESVGKDLGLEQTTTQLKERADGIGVNVQAKIKQSKEMIDEFSLSGKVKDFTLSSVKVAQEIDAELQKENCQYEVNNFRVSASAGMMAGMTLDLHFTKTPGAKKISEQESKYLSIINPGTGKPLKVLRSAVHGKDTVKLKDPDTGEVLVADTTSGKVLEIQPPAQATPS